MPPKHASRPPASRQAQRWAKDLKLIGAAAALVAAFLLGSAFLSPRSHRVSSSAPKRPQSASPPTAPVPIALAGGTLSRFTAEHNASLLWGTYRPGVYFGMRSRTAPTALVAGLMWTRARPDGGVDATTLRHQCEQDGLERYGFTAHDGRGFGSQPIVDRANGVHLTTTFVATPAGGGGGGGGGGGSSPGGWAVRISGEPIAGAAPKQHLFLYLSLDTEFAPRLSRGAALGKLEVLSFQPEEGVHVGGQVEEVGRFSLLAAARTQGGDPLPLRAWGSAARHHSHLNVAELVAEQLPPQQPQQQQQQHDSRLDLNGLVPSRSRLLVLQLRTSGEPFEIDATLIGGGCGAGGAVGDEECGALLARWSGGALSAEIRSRTDAFHARLASTFGLDEQREGGALRLGGSPLGEREKGFAAAALAAQLGSLGFFYGKTVVAPPPGSFSPPPPPQETEAAPLFAVVPSRPFFPRGFLWDDGFHSLVVGEWDGPLADDIAAHWLGLMHEDGWIPREQILGAEAAARVPAEFLPQRRLHANPPTLVLRLQRLLDRLPDGGGGEGGGGEGGGGSEAGRRLALLGDLAPRLADWYQWLSSTQAGSRPHTYRWRGRDKSDGRLNAMTLASGLDDYPRATVPGEGERHLDLLCWLAFFSRFLAQLSERTGDGGEAARYREEHRAQLASLEQHHWSPGLRAYCDWGRHANAGRFVQLVVVKCGTADGGSAVEHTVSDPERPDCPRSHPRFLFPLGDGKGGLLTRAKLQPRGLKDQHVEHLGYVSLFPLLLRLLPPDSPSLPHVLDLLRDPDRLWSPHGLRSLSKADAMWYGRENAPGDAPYWRGPIWVNLNYLCLAALRHYAQAAGPQKERSAALYAELREALVGTMVSEWERTGYFWEQYDPDTGRGQRTHPFNGWSSLGLLALAEVY